MKQLAVSAHSLAVLLGYLVCSMFRAAAEIHVQDNFEGATSAITASPLEVDLNRHGWTTAAGSESLWLSGDGKLVSPNQSAGRLAGIGLLPASPFAVITLSATVEMPMGDPNWIAFGLADGVHSLAVDQSGPWVKVHGSGLIELYDGSGVDSVQSQTVSYAGGPVEVVLTYNAYAGTMALHFAGASVFANVAITQTPGSVSTANAVIEFAPDAGQPVAFSVDDFGVDVIPRPRPLLTLPITDTILVSSYGALVNDGLDDSADIENALIAAKNLAAMGKVVELRFDQGQYTINSQVSVANGGPAPGSGCAVQLTGASNVWVNGNGAEILITNPTISFLRLFQCTNCIVEAFTVDYDPLPWTEGDVVTTNNAGGTNVVIDVRPGFPSPSGATFVNAPARWGYIIDSIHPGRLRDNTYSLYNTGTGAILDISDAQHPARFQIPLTDVARVSSIHAGDRWIQQARYGSALFNPLQCRQVTFIGITAYAGIGTSFAGQLNQLLGVVNCQVRIKPGRSKSTDADGVLQQNNRIAPWIEGCVFEGMADDATHFYTFPYVILQTNVGGDPAAYKVGNFGNGTTSANFGALEFAAGDQVAFFNPQDGTVFGHATVVSANTSAQVITLSAAVPNVVTGASQTATFIFNESLNSSGVIVKNQFLNSRRFGALCKASHTLIADNTFSGLTESGIIARDDLGSFVDGLFPSNLLITRNVFSECGNDFEAITTSSINATPVFASISLHKIENHGTTTSDSYVTTGREFTGIHILGNTFNSWRRAAVRLMNCDGVEIIGNTFGQPKVDFTAPNPGNRLVDLHYSDNITVANNSALNVQGDVATLLSRNCTAVTTDNAFDSALPTLSTVMIGSSNANGSLAKIGDLVTVNFTSSEAIQTPTVTLLGETASIANSSGNNWTATAMVAAGTGEGAATFSIAFSDLATNAGIAVNAVTDGSRVTVDKTAPAIAVLGSNPMTAMVDGTYTDAGATAADAVSGSVLVTPNGSVNTAVPGDYTITYTAIDAAGNGATATRMVTVPHTPHADWRVSVFGTQASDPAVAGDLVDPNQNGLVNLLEYALGGDPLGNTSGVGVLPVVGRDGNNHTTLNFIRNVSRADLTLTVQATDTPDGPWTDLAQSVAGGAFTPLHAGAIVAESGAGDGRMVTVSDLYVVGDSLHPQRYIRLKVER